MGLAQNLVLVKMNNKLAKIFLIVLLVFLSGCVHKDLTQQEYSFLQLLRNHWPEKKADSNPVLKELIYKNPEKLAKEDVRKGDFKLIALAMGYRAGEEDAETFGVKCEKPVETKKVVFGCVPPPPVLFKLMIDYNLAMIQRPGFPGEYGCKADEEVIKGIEEYRNELRLGIKQEMNTSIRKWEDEWEKSHPYN